MAEFIKLRALDGGLKKINVFKQKRFAIDTKRKGLKGKQLSDLTSATLRQSSIAAGNN